MYFFFFSFLFSKVLTSISFLGDLPVVQGLPRTKDLVGIGSGAHYFVVEVHDQ
jgi:hypothetical protein